MNKYHGIPNLVSIIMPSYNCSGYIEETINCVLAQTYISWELIIVDDCSSDDTLEILRKIKDKDNRVIVHQLEVNSGAAVARNKALEMAQGEYIAFLDSDDLWSPNKLELQINFMKNNNYIFTCTFYDKINENGASLNNIISYKFKSDYNDVLKNCPGNSTIIYNATAIEDKIYITPIKKRNDYLMWLNLMKKVDYLYCLEEVLSSHRIRENSLSKNKFSLVKYHWRIYRELEKVGLIKSLYLTFYWILKPIIKKIKLS